MVENIPANVEDAGLIPGSHGNPLQYSCLENPTDRGAWQAALHRVTKSQIRLSDLAHMHGEGQMFSLSF